MSLCHYCLRDVAWVNGALDMSEMQGGGAAGKAGALVALEAMSQKSCATVCT